MNAKGILAISSCVIRCISVEAEAMYLDNKGNTSIINSGIARMCEAYAHVYHPAIMILLCMHDRLHYKCTYIRT